MNNHMHVSYRNTEVRSNSTEMQSVVMFDVDDEGVDFLSSSGVLFDTKVDDLYRCDGRPAWNIPDTGESVHL